ncbi:cytochrome c3 family protein [Trichloromonas acetexigens]|nr:cytochrome c3 family protein [Desulfuromonas acetexigens]
MSTAAWGGDGTIVGAVVLKPGPATKVAEASKITVNIPYTGDDNHNNTAQIEWGLDEVDFTLGSADLLHNNLFYTHQITNLDWDKTYQIRVTVSDDDGGENLVQTLTGVKAYNHLVHNAVSTGSTRHEGSWGLADGQYGEFTCATCHDRSTGNIKRIKETITPPNPDHPLPGSSVILTDTREGTATFGDDSIKRTATPSNRICEVCHSETNYHRCLNAEQLGGVNHYNNKDCVSCHLHRSAFKASCDGCHGNTATGAIWPDDPSAGAVLPDRVGAHVEHMTSIGDILNGAGQGSATVANKNASCIFCHPEGAHTGAHLDDDHVDVYMDGTNGAAQGYYVYLLDNPSDPRGDTDGSYDPATGTCSLIDCHGNAPYTPGWYGDDLPPGAVTDLTAADSAEPGSVKLTWTAPGDDGMLDGTAYQYQMRYSTATITEANFAAAAIAGGAPSVDRRGKAEEMVASGLTPGQNYYFALKTADEAGNWSGLSNVAGPQTAHVDDVAPVFYGLDSATADDKAGAVNLHWQAAIDHSLPVTYRIWWSSHSLMDHLASLLTVTTTYYPGTNDEYTIYTATTPGLAYQVHDLSAGVLYNFLVRAYDAATPTNNDGNTEIKMALAGKCSSQPQDLRTYYANGPLSGTTTDFAAVLDTSGYTASVTKIMAANDNIIWIFGTPYAVKKKVTGLSFDIYAYNGDRQPQVFSYQLGYVDSDNTFIALGDALTVSLSKKSGRIMKLPLFSFSGVIDVGNRLAVQLAYAGGATILPTVKFGDAVNKGLLLVNEQNYNHAPGVFNILNPTNGSTQTGLVNISWTAATDMDNFDDGVHYDVYGSLDGGLSYPHQIVIGTTATSAVWDTIRGGVGLLAPNTQVRIRVEAGDGYMPDDIGTNHRQVTTGNFTIDNTSDTTAPAAIANLHAETRPKAGAVYLTWTAPGDDADRGRAARYDVRYSTSAITNETLFNAANEAVGEPVPGLAGSHQGFEVLGLEPYTTYYFAIKTADEADNWSTLSNSVSAAGGEKCGICHSTPPDEPQTAGTHAAHGYTKKDCAKCHGFEAEFFDVRHQDGLLKLGWQTDEPVVGTVDGIKVTYIQNGVKIYEDTTGSGGFNTTGGDNTDTGTCFGFVGTNAVGCHGPANTPPVWGTTTPPQCADCHGNLTRTTDPYGRAYDDASHDVMASPPLDNEGNSTGKFVGQHEKHLNFSFRFSKGDSCKLCHLDNYHADGIVDIKLDPVGAGEEASWNAGAGATPGTCGGTSTSGCHGPNPVDPPWDSAVPIACNNCHGHQDNRFSAGSPSSVTADRTATLSGNVTGDGSTVTIPVNSGYTIQVGDRVTKGNSYFVVASANSTSLTFSHAIPVGVNFTSGEVLISRHIQHAVDGGTVRACDWCHAEGHPQGSGDASLILLPNNPAVGIDYRSGGIHLKKVINGRTTLNNGEPIDTEAEICWGCHEDNGISEWGVNNNVNTGEMPYDYGSLNQTSWYGATWTSPNFAYKTGSIQSTHTANSVSNPGSSAVTGSSFNYTEAPDAVAKIRCSYCHDVHDMNMAEYDTQNGQPYLRGTWKGNPYKEDGAPWNKDYADVFYSPSGQAKNLFGKVPRGGTAYRELGGYFIDQNSDYPTSGWTIWNSAGLCVLCHGDDVDNMDQLTDEGLWLGTNGHSNSSIGGTFANKANIFDFSHGRPTPITVDWTNQPGSDYNTQVPSMAWMAQGDLGLGGGYRGNETNAGNYIPYVYETVVGKNSFPYAFNDYDWGVSVDADTTDVMYHQFSCSKCHNPHASRLPKLLITNCLDIQHNTWDENKTTLQTKYTNAALTAVDRNKYGAYYAAAQNCHRYDGSRATETLKGGWNKVSPWAP